ncbi:hypothetical protein C8R48DRAFT_601055, partial [Suillus tomentosus]
MSSYIVIAVQTAYLSRHLPGFSSICRLSSRPKGLVSCCSHARWQRAGRVAGVSRSDCNTEAINYAVWLKNCVPSRATPGHTPHDLVHGVKPSLASAHEFGTKVFV